MEYQYIIVEDQAGSIENLQASLLAHKNYKGLGVANTLQQGIWSVLTQRPHLVFLNVQLGKEKGFDLVKEIRQCTTELPYVIMTTDFDKYAKEAVNSDILYFLEKPIDPNELSLGLQKFEKRFLELRKHITIKNSEGHFFIKLNGIQYIQSHNNYCKIYREDGSAMMVTRTLKDVQSTLPPNFIRVHKSYIVNTRFVFMLNTSKKIIRLDVRKSGNESFLELPIGDSYLENVKHYLLTAKPN